jgi:hypothetical protein
MPIAHHGDKFLHIAAAQPAKSQPIGKHFRVGLPGRFCCGLLGQGRLAGQQACKADEAARLKN